MAKKSESKKKTLIDNLILNDEIFNRKTAQSFDLLYTVNILI